MHRARHRAPLAPAALALLLVAFGTACSGCSATTASRPAAGEAATHDSDGAPEPTLDGDYRSVEVATVGWDRLASAPVVLLRELETGQLVPIWVGVGEARAIASALHEIRAPRPMTHDLMNDLLGKLHGRLDELLIHDIVGGTYYGLLRLRLENGNGGETVLVDARPSDGMALALRAGAPIRVAQEILDQTPDVDFLAPDEPDQVVRALGLTVVAPTPELRAELAIPEEREGLVVIRAVGNAADAGLRRGDLLVSVEGEAVADPMALLDQVRALPFGEPVTIRYWREGVEREVEIVPEPPLPDPLRTDDAPGQVA